uniref:DNA binding protein n=1 Tax=Rhizophora mucronata TaxID=61149 RepID=A0A2P2NQM3_RHIMU
MTAAPVGTCTTVAGIESIFGFFIFWSC